VLYYQYKFFPTKLQVHFNLAKVLELETKKKIH
jgi:hypothetical protein